MGGVNGRKAGIREAKSCEYGRCEWTIIRPGRMNCEQGRCGWEV